MAQRGRAEGTAGTEACQPHAEPLPCVCPHPEALSRDLPSCPGCSHGSEIRVLWSVQAAEMEGAGGTPVSGAGGGSDSSCSSAGSEAQCRPLFVKSLLSVEKVKFGNGFKKKKKEINSTKGTVAEGSRPAPPCASRRVRAGSVRALVPLRCPPALFCTAPVASVRSVRGAFFH